MQFDTSESPDVNVDVSSPLAKYAAQYWIIHANSGSKTEFQSSSIFGLMMKLLTKENTAFVNWVRLHDIDNFSVFNWQKRKVGIAKPLYYASLAGLTEATHALLEMKVDVNAQGGEYGNALQAALMGGHEAIAKLLIENGADVNAQGGFYGNALQAASHQGCEEMAKLLIKNGANVNAQGGDCGTALLAALEEGHVAIAKLLIENEVDVNAQAYTRHPLYIAVTMGCEAIAKLLIEKGADVNAQGGFYGNALQAASYEGHEAIAKLLIENGADGLWKCTPGSII